MKITMGVALHHLLTVIGIVDGRDKDGFDPERLKYCDDYPKLLLAIHHYGATGIERAIECDEVHIPGDCPLCGAL